MRQPPASLVVGVALGAMVAAVLVAIGIRWAAVLMGASLVMLLETWRIWPR